MKKTSRDILFTSIPIIGVLLIGTGYLNTSNLVSGDIYEGVGQDDESGFFSEVVVPMSCTYRGKLKLDLDSQNSLKRFQRILK